MVKLLSKKLLSFILALLIAFVFCGCKNSSKTSSEISASPVVHTPDKGDNSLNGYRKEAGTETEAVTAASSKENSGTNSSTQSSAGKFCANTNSKIYHYATCSFASKISSENYYSSDSREDMINRGYRACKKCNADVDKTEESKAVISTQEASSAQENSSSPDSQAVTSSTAPVSEESKTANENITTQCEEDISVSYCVNTNTKVFHYSTCSYASKIAEKNYHESNSREEMESLGYRPCKRCNP